MAPLEAREGVADDRGFRSFVRFNVDRTQKKCIHCSELEPRTAAEAAEEEKETVEWKRRR